VTKVALDFIFRGLFFSGYLSNPWQYLKCSLVS